MMCSYSVTCECISIKTGTMKHVTVKCTKNGTDDSKDINRPEELHKTMIMTKRFNGSLDNKTDVINNHTYTVNNSNVIDNDEHNEGVTDIPYQPRKKKHLTIIIVGPTAAVSIALFLCIAYYFHNAQLNRKAKRLSFTIYVSPEPSSDSVISDTPRVTRVPKSVPNSPRASVRLSREASPVPRLSRETSPNAWLGVDNADVYGPRRKSTLTVNTLSVPSSIQSKRGSHNWNAFADHEILTLSAPRRHSTFII